MPNKTLAVTPGTGATINTLPDVGQQTKANSLPFTLASDQEALPLSPNAATATKQDEAKVVLANILSALQTVRTQTIWTDDSGKRYIRIDTGTAIVWTDVSGVTSAPPGAGARPDNDDASSVSRSTYRATASGSGYVSGDLIDHILVTNSLGEPVGNFWINNSSGLKISAPASGNIAMLSSLPEGAATDAKLEAIRALIAATLFVSGSVAVTNLPATQAVSATSLPLPPDASLASKQPNFGIAGTPSADVISVQGVSGGKGLTVDTIIQANAVSRSGTIGAANVSQTLMPANASRRGFVIQNQSSFDLYINGISAATTDQNSLKISPGDYYETQVHHVGTGLVSIICATVGAVFYAREF